VGAARRGERGARAVIGERSSALTA